MIPNKVESQNKLMGALMAQYLEAHEAKDWAKKRSIEMRVVDLLEEIRNG